MTPKEKFQSLLHQVSGANVTTLAQPIVETPPFQSLLHQVSGANLAQPVVETPKAAKFQSLLHQVSGANQAIAEAKAAYFRVSIPSSSGQWCQPVKIGEDA